MDVVTEEAIGLFNYFFGIAQIKFAAAGGADEVPVVHFGWVIMSGLFIFFVGLRRFNQKGDTDFKKNKPYCIFAVFFLAGPV